MSSRRLIENNNQNNTSKEPIDLTGYQAPRFICEYCTVELLPYPQLKLQNDKAGDGYICPKCGTVTDSSYTLMQHPVTIEPVDVGDSENILNIVSENKGPVIQYKEYDPEPDEEEWIKAQGGKIIDKKVEVKRDY